MDIIVQTSDEEKRALLQRLKGLNISHICGENVRTATSLIHGAIQRLEMVNAIPSDIVSILLDIYQTTSYQDFNKIFRTMKIALKIQSNSIYKIADITKIAETNFQELYESGIWQKADNNTVFINNSQKNNSSQGNNNNNNGENSNNKGNTGKKGKKGKGRRGRKNNHPKYIPSGPGEPHTKTWKDIEIHWCAKCKCWRTHTTERHTGPV